MPSVSRFYGIVICQYADDHSPPHFHAKYAGQDVAVEIEALEVLVGRLPNRAMRTPASTLAGKATDRW